MIWYWLAKNSWHVGRIFYPSTKEKKEIEKNVRVKNSLKGQFSSGLHQ